MIDIMRQWKPGHVEEPGFFRLMNSTKRSFDCDFRSMKTMNDKQSEPELEQPDEVVTEAPGEPIKIIVEARAHGWRVDHYLVRLYPNFSRAAFQRVLENDGVLINGLPVKMARRLRINDCLEFQLPETPDRTLPAEDIPLNILYDDDSLIVINKAANMIVHPGRGNYLGTLAGALQFHFDKLSDVAGQLR